MNLPVCTAADAPGPAEGADVRAAWLPWLLVFPVAVQAAAPQKPAAPDSVHLRFGWRPGMSAWVEFEGSRVRDGAVLRSTDIRWRLTVQAHERGLAVRTDSVNVRAEGGGEFERFLSRVTATNPTELVAETGEFLALEDVARHREVMLGALDSLLSSSEAPPSLRQSIAEMLSAGTLESSSADVWNSIVGFWTGADLEVGETLIAEVSSPSPQLPGVEIPQRMEFGAVRRLPCGADGNAGCVELRLVTVPDMERGRELIGKVLESLDAAVRDSVMAAFESVQVEDEVVLVTRPNGMFPQSVRKVRRTTARVRVADQIREVVQEDLKTRRYTWLEADRSPKR